MKRAISIVLLLLTEACLMSQNLVINPGFETWVKIDKPAGWTTAQYCLKDSLIIRSEYYSCRHEGGSTSKYLGQKIEVKAGRQYTLSFYYKTLITDEGNGCRIWCNWESIDGKIDDPSTEPLLHPSEYLRSASWEEFSIDITAPANAIIFYLEVRTYPKCITYWDDFIFEESIPTYASERKTSDIIMFPNPTHNYLIINNIENVQRIDIQDISGMVLWSANMHGEHSVTIPTDEFKNGIYLVNIRYQNKLIAKKFIKQ